MHYNPQNPIIVQGDQSVLLEAGNAYYEEARDILARFAELEKSPEYVHTRKNQESDVVRSGGEAATERSCPHALFCGRRGYGL